MNTSGSAGPMNCVCGISFIIVGLIIIGTFSISAQCCWAQPATQHVTDPSSQSKSDPHSDLTAPVPSLKTKTHAKRPPIKRIDENRLQVGEVIVDRKSRRVEVPAEVNLTRGILEYYGVGPEGKTHESVLKINAVPSHLHLALILAGYEPSEYGKPNPKSFRRQQIKRGSLLRLYLRWRPTGFDREQWVPAAAWIYDRNAGAPPKPHPYTFEGSLINSNGYAADIEQSIIGLIDDPTVVLAPTVDQGNPYQGERLGFEVYSSTIPPKGTPVTLVISKATKQEIAEIAHYEEELKELARAKRQKMLARDKLRPLPPPPPFELMLHLDARSQLTYRSKPPTSINNSP